MKEIIGIILLLLGLLGIIISTIVYMFSQNLFLGLGAIFIIIVITAVIIISI